MSDTGSRSGIDASELAAGVLTLGYSAVLNRVLPEASHVPVNLVAAGGMLALARGVGCDAEDLGLTPGSLRRGVVVGVVGGVAISSVIAAALVHSPTRRLFAEDRDEGRGEAAYHALVRIPVGTALAEELVFRGALLGILARGRPRWQAGLISSVLFGIWHVLPTHDQLDRSRVARDLRHRPAARTAAVAGTVGVTTLAGLGLSWLRLRSRSVAAPVLAHAAANVVAYLGGRLVAEPVE